MRYSHPGKISPRCPFSTPTVDRERIAYVKHYFDADWPSRALYDLMINTAMGDENVIATILNTMRLMEEKSQAKDPQIRGVLEGM